MQTKKKKILNKKIQKKKKILNKKNLKRKLQTIPKKVETNLNVEKIQKTLLKNGLNTTFKKNNFKKFPTKKNIFFSEKSCKFPKQSPRDLHTGFVF